MILPKYLKRELLDAPTTSHKYKYFYKYPTSVNSILKGEGEVKHIPKLDLISHLLSDPTDESIEQVLESQDKIKKECPEVLDVVNILIKDPSIKEIVSMDKPSYYRYTENLNSEGLATLDKLRFISKYKFDVEGFEDQRPQLAYIETLLDRLPSGFHKNNQFLTKLNYSIDNPNLPQYGLYYENAITLTDKADDIKDRREFNVNSFDSDFAMVFYHELGHSLENKLISEMGWKKFKEFSDLAGWDFSANELRDMANASEGDKFILDYSDERGPSNLITEYSNKNPFEAFSEYVATYYTNKDYLQGSLQENKDRELFNWIEKNVLNNSELVKTIESLIILKSFSF